MGRGKDGARFFNSLHPMLEGFYPQARPAGMKMTTLNSDAGFVRCCLAAIVVPE
ncbi:hypothetical protein HAX54_010280, partial [Datura stramonium]|nr:hypothetical protein [Datura stramonium]